MDEEVADPQSQGIEYTKIDQFYKWLTTHCKYLDCKYYELLVPFPKCIRIMRIRRHDKYRGNNRWEKEENRKNRKTIVIIRNGENIYAIDSKLTFERKLFPDQDELMNLYEELEQETFKESKQEAIDKTVHHYKSGMILMQGLIDRTEVFGNQFGKISFLNNKSAEEGKVVFKYEIDDNLIGDGTETFLDFLNKNELKKGDRVLVRYRNDNWHDIQSCLYKVYFKSDYCDIPPPEDGVYKIEWDKEYKCFYFRYNPKDKIWKRDKWEGWIYEERKKGFSFKLPSKANFWCPFDIVKHTDLDWIEKMQYDRRDRRQYLRVVPLLELLKITKREELEQEKPFALMMMKELDVDYNTIQSYIHWWKNKNMHKRTLDIDDMKAIRMIKKRHKSLTKNIIPV